MELQGYASFPIVKLLCWVSWVSWVSWVHYQSIPDEKPFDFNCSDIFTFYARLTAQLVYILTDYGQLKYKKCIWAQADLGVVKSAPLNNLNFH